MSDLPGEITKQSLSAPPAIIRSTRYSLMARGRSTWPSNLPPTGSNAFENASGWIRPPAPAAGIIPHIILLVLEFVVSVSCRRHLSRRSSFHDAFELPGSLRRRMCCQRSFARSGSDAAQFAVGHFQHPRYVVRVRSDQNFSARLEKFIQSRPGISDDRCATSCGFKQSPGGAPAHLAHCLASDIQGEPGGTKKVGMVSRRQVLNEENIFGPGKLSRVLRTGH